MPKRIFGEEVPEEYWEDAKKQAKKQGFSPKKDKSKFYSYTMGILKKMMANKINETTVAGDVAVPSGGISFTNTKPVKWPDIVKKGME